MCRLVFGEQLYLHQLSVFCFMIPLLQDGFVRRQYVQVPQAFILSQLIHDRFWRWQLKFWGSSHYRISLVQLTSWLLISFCNIKLVFWRYVRRRMTKPFGSQHNTCQSYCTSVAQLACGPGIVPSKPRASSGFIYRANSCQAHRPQGWSVNGREDFTPTPGISPSQKTTVTKRLGFLLCKLPAAVLFKELTWHQFIVQTVAIWTNFDLGNTFGGWGCEQAAVAPGDWAAAGDGAVRGIEHQGRLKGDEIRLIGCRVSAEARAEPLTPWLKFSIKVGQFGGRVLFVSCLPALLLQEKLLKTKQRHAQMH